MKKKLSKLKQNNSHSVAAVSRFSKTKILTQLFFKFQGSLEEWLRLLRLEEYGPALVAQGYRTVHDVTQLAWEVRIKQL